jgi:hypothetical protein
MIRFAVDSERYCTMRGTALAMELQDGCKGWLQHDGDLTHTATQNMSVRDFQTAYFASWRYLLTSTAFKKLEVHITE